MSTRRTKLLRLGMPCAIVLAVCMSGCGALNALNVKPSARIANVALQDISLESATLLFDVEVKNPYAVPLPLTDLDYALAVAGSALLSGKAELQGTVPAAGARTVSLPAKINYLQLLKAAGQVRPGSVVPYVADLGLSLRPPMMEPLRLPLKKEGKLPVPTVPEVEVQEIRWAGVSLTEASGVVKLHLVNRNQFPVGLSALRYALSLGGTEVANSAVTRSVDFAAAGGAGIVEIPISVSPAKLGMGLVRLLAGSGSEYKLAGDVNVRTPFGPMSLPVQKIGQTVFKR